MQLLGFTAQAGGESASAGSQAKSRGVTDLTDDNIESSYNALAAGYGMISFTVKDIKLLNISIETNNRALI